MEAVVNVLVENLTELLYENFQLISDVEDDVKKLLRFVNGFKSFLKESRKIRTENDIVKQLEKEIMDVVYRSENLIDQYVVDAKIHAERFTSFLDYPLKREVARKIKAILEEIKVIQDKKEYQKVIEDKVLPRELAQSVLQQQQKVPRVEEEYVVGFDEEAKIIIQRLREGSSYGVISVFGMPGLGKTTLANKVFKSEEIEYHFMYRVWIYVSQFYKKRDVYLQILKKLQQPHDCDIKVTEEELASKIKEVLGHVKYFVVLDDVWSVDAFNDIQDAFPKSKGSRVLVTTREERVATIVRSLGEPHRLKFLEPKESWELLEKKVFREERCPDDLKEYGEEIAKKCDGLPLAVVIIAGILLGKSKTRLEWRNVAISFSDFLRMNIESYQRLIQLSYDHLPDDLKSCFLYLGAFPNGNHIPAAKLMQLWIAEGFIEEEGVLTMEVIAGEKLCSLVSRNLVMATQRKTDGQIKTCRVHDMLLQFCKKEAKAEDLFNEINETNIRNQQDSCRRLSVHCSFKEFISSKQNPEYVRSLLCFASNRIEMPPQIIQSLRKAFPLLRVLHFAPDESIIFMRCHRDFSRLFHLRYIAISTTLKTLPTEIGNLRNVQTLIVRTSESTLEIKGDIWSMSRLRHLQTNSSAKLPPPSSSKTKKDPFPNQNLQTLSKVSPLSCTAAALAKAPNLKKLGIRGTLAKLFETDKISGSSLFKNLRELKFLENLKLWNDGEELQHLPQKYEFPTNLTKLTLSKTYLPWCELSVLGTLEKLEILKLIEHAVVGEYWEPIIGGFLCLQVLHIERTDLRSLKASNKHFPRLKSLALRHCEKLEAIPLALADISSLEIDLNHSKMAIPSAQDILKQKQQKQDPTEKPTHRFKLTIYPPLDPSQAS
ncbi:PREDICTED: putative late blight resistance protein homolog R1B-14 [Ipomoea nil]|uniref:putative late blight resistance protein homolog R1B-14 n=1 Tax=Ipomoea nil TaxID=35883 RepID=UPI0009012E1E|nr:PREDICTED: putative late blight resistance protein homolog R1B-14 [Ipomoea nil]XP_019200124.1 PREDICTED: putative late blight resistance protein homolog R1B-14 [Ipomoea nil]